MTSFIPLIEVIIYFIIVYVVLSRWAGLREQTVEDYAVASRSFKWYMMVFTILATWFVGAVYTAFFSLGVTTGQIVQYCTVYTVMGLIVFYFLSPRVWIWGKAHKLANMPDYIELRYHSKPLGIAFALLGLGIGAPWQVIGFKTLGYAVDAISYQSLPTWTSGSFTFNIGLLVVGLFVTWYVVAGGMRNIVIADFVQGIITVALCIVAIVYVAYKLFGGFGDIMQRVAETAPDKLVVVQPTTYWSGIILAGALGGYCWLELFNRIFVAESVKELKMVARGAPILATLLSALLGMLAMAGLFYKGGIIGVREAETAFLTFMNDAGGPLLLGFASLVIVASTMSAFAAQLGAFGVVVARNVIDKFRRTPLSDRGAVKASRIACFIWSIIAILLSMMDMPFMITFAIKTYELIISLFPAIVIGCFWRRANKYGTWSGLAVGLIISLVLSYTPDFVASLPGYLGGWPPGVYGFVANLIVFVVVSLATKPDEGVDDLFEFVGKYREEEASEGEAAIVDESAVV